MQQQIWKHGYLDSFAGRGIFTGRDRHAGSLLAEDAQDLELSLILPAIRYTENKSDIQLMLHLHDGIIVFFRDKKRAASRRNGMIRAVRRHAAKLGVHTSLEWTPCGQAAIDSEDR